MRWTLLRYMQKWSQIITIYIKGWWQHRCWWRMLESGYVGDNLHMLKTGLRVVFILTIRGNNDWLIDSFEKYGKQNCIFYSYHKYFHSVCHSTKGWWIIIMHTRIYTYSMQSRTSICGFCNVINTSFQIVSNIGGQVLANVVLSLFNNSGN